MVLMAVSTMWNVSAMRGIHSVRDLSMIRDLSGFRGLISLGRRYGLLRMGKKTDGVDHEAEGNLYLFCNGKVSVKGAARRESFLKEFQFSQNR